MAETGQQGTFSAAMAGFAPELKAIAKALKDVILSIDTDCVELAWPRMKIASYGVGPKKMSEHYAYIAPQKDYVNLGFYHGVALQNSAGLLERTGKRLRHIKIRSVAEARGAAVKRLLTAAVLERKRAAK